MSAIWSRILAYVREERFQDPKFDVRFDPAIYCGRSSMDNNSSYVLYKPNNSRGTFVSCNNVVFANKCPMAKDATNATNSTRSQYHSTASSVDSILHQTDTLFFSCLHSANDKRQSEINVRTSVCFIFCSSVEYFVDSEQCVHYESSFVS
jgi:hypothetical protein